MFKEFCHKLDVAMQDAKVFSKPSNLSERRMLNGLIKASGGHVGRVCRIIEAATEQAALRDAEHVEPFDVSIAVETVAMIAGWVGKNPFKPTGS